MLFQSHSGASLYVWSIIVSKSSKNFWLWLKQSILEHITVFLHWIIVAINEIHEKKILPSICPAILTSIHSLRKIWWVIRCKNTPLLTFQSAVSKRRKVCLEPVKSLVRFEIESVKKGPPKGKSHLDSPVCHKAITLTHLRCLTHAHMCNVFRTDKTFPDRNTYRKWKCRLVQGDGVKAELRSSSQWTLCN